MFEAITPVQAGSTSADIYRFMQIIDEYCPGLHSVILARGGKIFYECYYEPFHKDFKHRMYSVSKSFVSVAVGLLIEDGKLQLTDRIVDLFPEYAARYVNYDEDPEWESITIRDMLTMSTAHTYNENWLDVDTDDRAIQYFQTKTGKLSGTHFDYDSGASDMMAAVVERITGRPFMDLLRDRIFRHIGFSEDAYCLQAPGGRSFGASAVLCTSRDLLAFAQFVMNQGTWEGQRYMNAEYLAAATTKQVDNNEYGMNGFENQGYGYQFWIDKKDRFFFNGMGCQLAICDPAKDFICVVNADCQGNAIAKHAIVQALYDHVLDQLDGNDAVKAAAESACSVRLRTFTESRKLHHLQGATTSPFVEAIFGKTYQLRENPMGIHWFRLEAQGQQGRICFENATGEKALTFGLGYNEFGKFPEEGYSDLVVSKPCPGNFYDCAASAAWAEPKKLQIKVQVIDKYLGNGTWTLSFKGDLVNVTMTKTAEGFMNEYVGRAVGQAEA